MYLYFLVELLTHSLQSAYIRSTRYNSIDEIIYIAENHGIQIVYEYTENTDLLGYYSENTHSITMCNAPQNTDQYTDLNEETLRHELLHAIQHCKGNYNNYVLVTDSAKINECLSYELVDKKFIDSHTPEKMRVFEYEAYCLENTVSYDFLAEQIDKYCR